MQYAYNGSTIGYIYQDGTAAVVYSTTSDYRRKSNVKNLTGSGTFIDALKPRTFDWDTGDKGVGFIAHEFAEVSPTSVSGEKDAVDLSVGFGVAEKLGEVGEDFDQARLVISGEHGAGSLEHGGGR
jgi:hypothetical protein